MHILDFLLNFCDYTFLWPNTKVVMDGIQWGKSAKSVIALGHFTWRENALDLLLLKKDRKKHLFLCPMWATEKQERTWVSVGRKKVYSSISNSNYCIYPLPSNYIVHKYLAKSQKYDTYCNYNSLYLFLSFDESVG